MSCLVHMRGFVFALLLLVYCSLFCGCDNDNEQDALQETTSQGKKLCIIGDSISTFKGFLVSDKEGYKGDEYWYYYPCGDVQSVNDTWWVKVANRLGIPKQNINNCSWSSSTVTGDALSKTNAYSGCSIKRLLDIGFNGFTPDIIICFISCNDWSANCPIGDWDITKPLTRTENVYTLREAYAIMLEGITSLYPKAEVFCMTNLVDVNRDKTNGYPSNNAAGITTEEWNNNLAEVADFFGCTVIETNDCGINYENIMQYVVDSGLHPNSLGMSLIAERVSEVIVDKLGLNETY